MDPRTISISGGLWKWDPGMLSRKYEDGTSACLNMETPSLLTREEWWRETGLDLGDLVRRIIINWVTFNWFGGIGCPIPSPMVNREGEAWKYHYVFERTLFSYHEFSVMVATINGAYYAKIVDRVNFNPYNQLVVRGSISHSTGVIEWKRLSAPSKGEGHRWKMVAMRDKDERLVKILECLIRLELEALPSLVKSL